MKFRFSSLAVAIFGGWTRTASAQTWGNNLQVGDEICVEGYVMDYYCIERGRLLDNNSVETLGPNGPIEHTVHCLVDVGPCVSSPFEILLPSPDDSDRFIRGWRLEDSTKQQVIELARTAGSCGTCDCQYCGDDAFLERGFHVGLTAVVTDLGTAGIPPTIQLVQGWSQSNGLRVTDPNNPASTHCDAVTGSAYPPNGMTEFPTASPTWLPTSAPTLEEVIDDPTPPQEGDDDDLQAFSTTLNVAENVQVAFEVIPQDKAVEITVSVEGTGWVAIGSSPTGSMTGTTACIARGDGNPPQLYDTTGNSGVTLSATQNLLDTTFTQDGTQSVLVCKAPIDLTEGFAFSSKQASSFVVAWGDGNEFGYHGSNNRLPNLSVNLQPAKEQQPQVLQAFTSSADVADDVEVAFQVIPQEEAVEITMTRQGTGWLAIGASPNGRMPGTTACIGQADGNPPQLYDTTGNSGVTLSANQNLMDATFTQDGTESVLICKIPIDLAEGFAFSSTSPTSYVVAWGDDNEFGYHGSNNRVSDLSVALQPEGADDGGEQTPGVNDDFPAVGDEVCIEGYVMDVFCIARGTLFDNNSIRTLSPESVAHTVHCLVDVPQCVQSPYEILLQPLEEGDDFVRGWRLDDASKNAVIALAKDEGQCNDGCTGAIRSGFHVYFNAEVLDVGDADTPPTVSIRGDVATNTPENLSCPGGSARPAPFVEGQDDNGDSDTGGPIQLRDDLLLEINGNTDDTVSFKLEYEGEGWVAVAVSTSGRMVGSQAVIGLPGSGQDPQIYDLNDRDDSGVVPSETQILVSSSITQEDGITTLTFTVPVETEGFFVSAEEETGFLYAFGSDNTLGYHLQREPFRATIGGAVTLAEDPTPYYKAHGFLMALAWGLFCPLAIGASLLRNLFPPGMFFQIHRALNTSVVVLTIIAFGLAVKATNIENLDHFKEVNHRKIGLAIFLFALMQATNGFLRPHLPHKPDAGPEDKDSSHLQDEPETPEEKSTPRKIWEVGHRVFGLLILVLAWANCTTGIDQFFLKFPDEGNEDAVTGVFWAITGGITGLVVLGYGAMKVL